MVVLVIKNKKVYHENKVIDLKEFLKCYQNMKGVRVCTKS